MKPTDTEGAEAAVLDTVIIQRQDLFSREAASSNPFLGLANDLHATTKRYVIRRELLLRAGAVYDSSLAAESERNLRALGLFRSVRVDTSSVNGRRALRVTTKDAWSLQPRATARIASDGTLTGSFGVTETNVAGTGNSLRLWYVRQADRDGLVMSGSVRRLRGTRVGLSGAWSNLSDRSAGRWSVANPFRSFSDRWSVFYGGEAFSGRVLQFRVPDASVRDTTEWRRRAFVNRGFVTFAPVASARRYLRVGASVEVRREEFFRVDNPAIDPDSVLALVPDTVTGLVGAFVEYRRARFQRVRRFNGFTEEDQDLSDLAFLSLKLAPEGFGYPSTGVGARVVLASGVSAGPVILKGLVDGNALFNAAGLDSGRVVGTGTVAVRSGDRHATFLQVSGGVQDGPPPGAEFDLGFETLPRLWGPHAFVGTRSVRATLEHRFYAIDEILGIIGLGFAGFVDYGGAWYEDQSSRLGGDAGIALFAGSPLGSFAQVVHISGGYRFGGGVVGADESRWSVTLGSGIIF
ncbi:MAG: hypothetical protein R3266_05495 [Gemmatimonadota bacterium]|nr:hypothetical protein [Gemmatimonadota bacterium]